jgi:hypothetical protein
MRRRPAFHAMPASAFWTTLGISPPPSSSPSAKPAWTKLTQHLAEHFQKYCSRCWKFKGRRAKSRKNRGYVIFENALPAPIGLTDRQCSSLVCGRRDFFNDLKSSIQKPQVETTADIAKRERWSLGGEGLLSPITAAPAGSKSAERL